MFSLGLDGSRPLRVLAIGAHCDDIEIGAGGTLAVIASERPDTQITCVILTSNPTRAAEARACLADLCVPVSPVVRIESFRDSRLPTAFDEIKDLLADLAGDQWDLVFTHQRYDAHQDHRLLGELVPTALRNHLVLQFEIPKWDGDLGSSHANVYVPLSQQLILRKSALLHHHYASQRNHDWFDAETFQALARLRGMECRAAYAEAFRVEKLTLDLSPTQRAI